MKTPNNFILVLLFIGNIASNYSLADSVSQPYLSSNNLNSAVRLIGEPRWAKINGIKLIFVQEAIVDYYQQKNRYYQIESNIYKIAFDEVLVVGEDVILGYNPNVTQAVKYYTPDFHKIKPTKLLPKHQWQTVTYKVKKGDDLNMIAQRLDVSILDLLSKGSAEGTALARFIPPFYEGTKISVVKQVPIPEVLEDTETSEPTTKEKTTEPLKS